MKFVKTILVFFIILCLSGCKYGADYIDPEDRYIITAIGIQKSNEGVMAVIEAPKEIDTKQEAVKVFSASGQNIKKAIQNASDKIPGELLFSQCPVILLDRSVEGDLIDDIFDLCLSDYEISLSVQFVACENPQKILSEDTSDTSVGYTIHRTVNYSNKNFNFSGTSRFAKIFNDNYKTNDFSIPCISLKNGIFLIDGFQRYRDNYLYDFVNVGALESYE